MSISPYQTAPSEPCPPCVAQRHQDCTENYCTCDCPAMIAAEGEALVCCGQHVDDDGYCQHRRGHPRRITPKLLEKAVAAAASESSLEAQVRAVLVAVL